MRQPADEREQQHRHHVGHQGQHNAPWSSRCSRCRSSSANSRCPQRSSSARPSEAAPTTPASSPSSETTNRRSGLGCSIQGAAAVGDPVGQVLAELLGQPAADDDEVEVEQVDRRADRDAEGLDRRVEQLGRELVPVLQRLRPHLRGERRLVLLVADVEQRGLPAGVDHRDGDAAHRAPPGVGLGAAASTAGAQRAAGQDDHVPDLAGRAPRAGVGPAVEDQPAADAGAHPQPQHVAHALRGPGEPLAEQADVGVVAQRHRHAEPLPQRARPGRPCSFQSPRFGHGEHLALVHHAGDADARRRSADRRATRSARRWCRAPRPGPRSGSVPWPGRDLVVVADQTRPRCWSRPRRPRPPADHAASLFFCAMTMPSTDHGDREGR